MSQLIVTHFYPDTDTAKSQQIDLPYMTHDEAFSLLRDHYSRFPLAWESQEGNVTAITYDLPDGWSITLELHTDEISYSTHDSALFDRICNLYVGNGWQLTGSDGGQYPTGSVRDEFSHYLTHWYSKDGCTEVLSLYSASPIE